jgi:DNA-directed RNA polymerase subunit RPC12/RpoP
MVEKAQFTCSRCWHEFEKRTEICTKIWKNGLVKKYVNRCPKCRKTNYTEITYKYGVKDELREHIDKVTREMIVLPEEDKI